MGYNVYTVDEEGIHNVYFLWKNHPLPNYEVLKPVIVCNGTCIEVSPGDLIYESPEGFKSVLKESFVEEFSVYVDSYVNPPRDYREEYLAKFTF